MIFTGDSGPADTFSGYLRPFDGNTSLLYNSTLTAFPAVLYVYIYIFIYIARVIDRDA